jgi:hypothetical protein
LHCYSIYLHLQLYCRSFQDCLTTIAYKRQEMRYLYKVFCEIAHWHLWWRSLTFSATKEYLTRTSASYSTPLQVLHFKQRTHDRQVGSCTHGRNGRLYVLIFTIFCVTLHRKFERSCWSKKNSIVDHGN